MSQLKFINDRIKKLSPYSVPQVSEGEIKLDAQENPYHLPDKLKVKLSRILSEVELNRYPDPKCKNLRKKIGEYCKLEGDNILVGNGSDELILMLLLASGGEGKKVVYPQPTFSMYKILSQLTGTKHRGVPLGKDFSLPDGKILSENPDIIFLTYPNNPTGNCFSRDKVINIIENTDGLVVIDEAYYEFSGKTFRDFIEKYDNIVILRTFSKAFSLAGIRAGYMMGSKNIIRELDKVQLPYNISIVNQKLLEAVMDNRDLIKPVVKKLNKFRDELIDKINKIDGITPFPSEANYILMKIDNIDRVIGKLKENNIKVREFSDKALKDYLRVTVGNKQENKNFLKALKT
ncbi:MAG: histidinol-phosphate transaminase [Elusimicrobiota bacterium]